MPIALCPHCGANRQGMPDEQPCWRCRRLPMSNQGAGDIYKTFASPNIPPLPTQAPKKMIPSWLVFTGTLGILLFFGLAITMGFLFVTAEPEDEFSAEENQSQEQVTNPTGLPSLPSVTTVVPSATNTIMVTGTMPTALPTNTIATVDSSASTTESAAVGPFAETAVAIQPSATPSLLPTPSLAPSSTPITPTPVVCNGVLPTQLAIDMNAGLATQNTLRLRDNPTLNSNVLLNVSSDQIVTIIGAPVCAEGYLWWEVQLSPEVSGWMAEADDTQYFLEPFAP